MGGAVSSGRDNNELIDNLMGGSYIRTRQVERVFRVLDRADYMTPDARDQAYKDLAWRSGLLHLSAPCIYSEVMEGLELRPGLSFLNIGSGTGYLTTLVGLILGSGGISHAMEVYQCVTDYSTKKLGQFLEKSATLDEFDFCIPKFYCGNGLCLGALPAQYDRVYCGAACPEEFQNYFKQLIKVGGVLVMPLNDNLVQIKRLGPVEWQSRSLLNVSFAMLRVPGKEEASKLIKLDELAPPKLQFLARATIREAMRGGLFRRHPELREPPPKQAVSRQTYPRRICIPIEEDSDVEHLNSFHDLDHETGANEMNALLSLVLSMGHNRIAGALRLDSGSESDDSAENSDVEENDDDDDDDDDDGHNDNDFFPFPPTADEVKRVLQNVMEENRQEIRQQRSIRSLLTFEIQNNPLPNLESPSPTPRQRRALDRNRNTASTSKCDENCNNRTNIIDETENVTKTDDNGNVTTDNDATDSKTDGSKGDANGNVKKKSTEGEASSSRLAGMPAEVEIYLDKEGDMEWEKYLQESSDEEEESTNCPSERKRQKLDSGIGEESTPSSGTSPNKSFSKTDESDTAESAGESSRQGSGSATDGGESSEQSGSKRKVQKRTRSETSRALPPAPDERDDDVAGDGPSCRCSFRGPDARRVRLSIRMKQAIKELPLPHALKKFVNLGRCFEF